MAQKRRRRSRSELRSLVLDGGADLVRAEGQGIGASNITYKAVFEHLLATQGIVVTRGSVHERIWNSLQDFRLDVLRHVAATEIVEDDVRAVEAAIDAAIAALAATEAATDADIGKERSDALRTAMRVGATSFLDPPDGERWKSWLSVISAFGFVEEHAATTEGTRRSVADQYETLRAEIITPLREFLCHLGLRPSVAVFGDDLVVAEARAYPVVATMLHALSEGANLRRSIDAFALDSIVLDTGPDRGHERWNLVGLHAYAVVLALFEPQDATI